jgi:hypothetical protein
MAFNWQKWSLRVDTTGKVASVLFALWSGYFTYVSGVYAGLPPSSQPKVAISQTSASQAAVEPALRIASGGRATHEPKRQEATAPLTSTQKVAVWTIRNGGWWGGAGAVLGGIFIGCFIFWWVAVRKLRHLGEAFPCVKALLRAVQSTLKSPPFECSNLNIVLYKAKDNRRLVAVAAAPALGNEPEFKLDPKHPDYKHNQELAAECWISNRDVDRRAQRRRGIHVCKAKHPWAKSMIALPVIVSEEDTYPWGVMLVQSRKYLPEDQCKEIVAALQQEGDILETLERLLERHRRGHAFSLA